MTAPLPHLQIGELPTPLEEARTLGTAMGTPGLLVKRDDLSGLPYGGNKVRKLEYLLAEALASGCDTVLTFGAAGSNHALATSIYAQRLGLAAWAVLVDQLETPYLETTLRWHALLGTRLVHAEGFADAARVAARLRTAHPGGAGRVHEIPWGGSSVSGTLGFVNAGREIAAQLAARSPRVGPLRIYLPCGTMGSAAGLSLGLALADMAATIVCVKVVPQRTTSAESLRGLVLESQQKLAESTGQASGPLRLPEMEFRTEFLGAGYADVTPEARAAVELAADLHGLQLDTTYSAKAFACLWADARAGLLEGRTPIFWQTYNSRPAPAGIESVDLAALPAAFRQLIRPRPPA